MAGECKRLKRFEFRFFINKISRGLGFKPCDRMTPSLKQRQLSSFDTPDVNVTRSRRAAEGVDGSLAVPLEFSDQLAFAIGQLLSRVFSRALSRDLKPMAGNKTWFWPTWPPLLKELVGPKVVEWPSGQNLVGTES